VAGKKIMVAVDASSCRLVHSKGLFGDRFRRVTVFNQPKRFQWHPKRPVESQAKQHSGKPDSSNDPCHSKKSPLFHITLGSSRPLHPFHIIKRLPSSLKVANQLVPTSGLELPEAGGLLDPAKHLYNPLFGVDRFAVALMACSAVINR
jgi:hypothetical protein